MEKDRGFSYNPRLNAAKECNRRIDRERSQRQVFIYVWEGVLQFIAGLSAMWGNLETGGELYGLFGHSGRPVIIAATPPGRNAIHRGAAFLQDIEFVKRTNALLRKYFGIQFLGNYHSHHYLNLNGPSHRDREAIKSISKRNGYRQLCQFVSTFENLPLSGFRRGNGCAMDEGCLKSGAASKDAGEHLSNICERTRSYLAPPNRVPFVRINVFLYLDAMGGEPVRCPIRLIRGTSPFSRAILRNSAVPELTKNYSFPMSRILFESFEPPEDPPEGKPELPEGIFNQWLQLPEKVREKTRVVYKDNLIMLTFPVSKGSVYVAYNSEPPQSVKRIYFCEDAKDAKPNEISKAVLRGPFTELPQIYERAVRLVESKGMAAQPERLGETDGKADSQENHSRKEKLSIAGEMNIEGEGQ